MNEKFSVMDKITFPLIVERKQNAWTRCFGFQPLNLKWKVWVEGLKIIFLMNSICWILLEQLMRKLF